MKHFNPKKYQGKDRVYIAISWAAGISRLYVWDEQKRVYRDPKNGKKYMARRYEGRLDGKLRRKFRFFESLSEAQEWLSTCLKRSKTNRPSFKGLKHIEVEPSPVVADSSPEDRYTLWNLICDFKKHRYPLLREGTQIMYDNRMPLLEPLFSVEVEDLSPYHIDEWFDWLKGPKRLKTYRKSRVSFDKEIELLKNLLNWHLGRSYNSRLKMPFLKKHYEEMYLRPKKSQGQKFMTQDEVAKWFLSLQTVAPRFWAPAVTQVDMLLRVSEVFAMKWSNLDLQRRVYRVREYAFWPRKNGQKPEIRLGNKTMREGEFYEVPLRQRVVEILSELQDEASCDLIFHNQGEIWAYRQIQHAYNKAFKAAGLPYRSTHVCRHTGATALLEETGDRLAVQQMGNWKSSQVAENYAKVMNDRAKRAVAEADRRKRLTLVHSINQSAQ